MVAISMILKMLIDQILMFVMIILLRVPARGCNYRINISATNTTDYGSDIRDSDKLKKPMSSISSFIKANTDRRKYSTYSTYNRKTIDEHLLEIDREYRDDMQTEGFW